MELLVSSELSGIYVRRTRIRTGLFSSSSRGSGAGRRPIGAIKTVQPISTIKTDRILTVIKVIRIGKMNKIS